MTLFNLFKTGERHKAAGRSRSQFAAPLLSLLLMLGLLPASIAAQELQIISETAEGGIVETRFDIEINGETVPGILWTPQGAQGTRPLIAFGHGGTQHKRVTNILRMARDMVTTENYAAVAIDAPGHGDRGRVEGTDTTATWMAVLDAVQRLDHVGEGPIGYWGVSMGTAQGVPLVAADSRIEAAVLGLLGMSDARSTSAWAESARSITVPLIFMFQREDRIADIPSGLALYDAFGSEDKAMHINPGGHTGVPPSERDKWKPFFVQHLGKASIRNTR